MSRQSFGMLSTWLGAIALVLPAPANSFDLKANFVAEISSAVDIRNAGDGSQRLFLARQDGFVFMLKDNVLAEEPFLDISNRVADAPEDYLDEYNYGLLSIAFAPDYATSGIFYVNYTDNEFTQTISRFHVSADPDEADAASEEVLLTFTLPSVSHNGGHLVFGPDGYLYITVGDGQDSGVPTDAPQELDQLMGKILRIDVSPGHTPFGIPADNPFASAPGARGEIWAYGLRNPWRIAFDPATGGLYISDVGEFAWEEVNYQPANSSGGQNYGWRQMEGKHCHADLPNCSQAGLTLPVAEYGHPDGTEPYAVVIGGEVYLGSAYPELKGSYLYADGFLGKFWSLKCDSETCQQSLLAEQVPVVGGPRDGDLIDAVLTFGKGEDGSMYFSDFGWVYKLSDGPLAEEPGFKINSAISDAWYNPDTPGQGFFINVLPGSRSMFVGFFTFETKDGPSVGSAALGDTAHRWLTAYGAWSGNTATLNVELTTNGIFDDSQPVEQNADYGTMEISFEPDCMHAVVHLVVPNAEIDRTIPIQRISPENRQACLDLAMEAKVNPR